MKMKQKSLISTIGWLTLVVFAQSIKTVVANSDIVAIDVLLDPDKNMLDSAKAYNKMMRKNYSGPGSFSLDDSYVPHLTVMQCHVKRADHQSIYSAVSKVIKEEQPTKGNQTARSFYYLPMGGLGLAGITTDTTTQLMRFQSKLIEVMKPFIVVGTDATFVQNENGKPITAGTSEYVNGFISGYSGVNYNPHVTIGLANLPQFKRKPKSKWT